MRFLLHWQHVAGEDQVKGAEGLAAVIEQLEGFELAAAAWENDVLPARVADYGGEQIDQLCLSGRVAWGRLTPGTKAPLRTSPIALMLREHAAHWGIEKRHRSSDLSSEAKAVREALEKRGASFFHELVNATGLLPAFVERGAGRACRRRHRHRRQLRGPARALLRRAREAPRAGGDGRPLGLFSPTSDAEGDAEAIARTLLKRYGVVFRVLLQRESQLPPWRELVRVYRRLEARGEIRGGRFVAGFGGEQFAAADAVGRLRAVRKRKRSTSWWCSAPPIRSTWSASSRPRRASPAIHTNRILFRMACRSPRSRAGRCAAWPTRRWKKPQLRTLLARRSLRHPPRLHLRSPTPRETSRLERARDRVMNFPWSQVRR